MGETDKLGVKVVSNWEEERRVRTRVLEVEQHRFAGIGGSKKIQINKVNASPMLAQNGFDHQPQQQLEQQQIDPKETDAVLTELNMMSGRWQLLRRFLYSSLLVSFLSEYCLLFDLADP